jgi:hypothetical protein
MGENSPNLVALFSIDISLFQFDRKVIKEGTVLYCYDISLHSSFSYPSP